MKHKSLVLEVIKKEAYLISMFKNLKLQVMEGSVFDISYFEEVVSLIGVPSSQELKNKGIDPDKFVDDYVACVHGDKNAQLVLDDWEKVLKGISLEYKKNDAQLTSFLQKEKALFSGIKTLGENSNLKYLIKDWDLAQALFLDESEQFSQKMFKIIEQGGSFNLLLKP